MMRNSQESSEESPHPRVHLNSSDQSGRNSDFPIKWIDFKQRRLPILLQNQNGPCPLLAIANILLLRQRVEIRHSFHVIDTEQIMSMVANQILNININNYPERERDNYAHNIQDAINILPTLVRGMDVNIKFFGVDKFEYTRECAVFDLLKIRLFHGWVVDENDREIHQLIKSSGSSYNQLVEMLVQYKNSNDDESLRKARIIEQFLNENRSQMTDIGLVQLQQIIKEEELAVFFRNNHFSVIWKKNEKLFLLVSDHGYLNHPMIVFETLNSINNDGIFTDGYGQTWERTNQRNLQKDHELALQLQREEQLEHEEEYPYRKSLSQEFSQRRRPLNQDQYQRRRPRRDSFDDRGDCCILL